MILNMHLSRKNVIFKSATPRPRAICLHKKPLVKSFGEDFGQSDFLLFTYQLQLSKQARQDLNSILSVDRHVGFSWKKYQLAYPIQALALDLPHPLLPRRYHFPRQQLLWHTDPGILLQFLRVLHHLSPKTKKEKGNMSQIY